MKKEYIIGILFIIIVVIIILSFQKKPDKNNKGKVIIGKLESAVDDTKKAFIKDFIGKNNIEAHARIDTMTADEIEDSYIYLTEWVKKGEGTSKSKAYMDSPLRKRILLISEKYNIMQQV